MPGVIENLSIAVDAIRAHKLRASLTVLGLTMGVATLITVMTLVQGANLYVEQKIANLGTNVFQVGRVPFAVADFGKIIKALRNKYITLEDLEAVAQGCPSCEFVGGQASSSTRARYRDTELQDTNLIGQTPNMAYIDTRTVLTGRFFTDLEDLHGAQVCLIGDTLVKELFGGGGAAGKVVRLANQEFTVIGTFEKIGAVLGQEQDNFAVIPMSTYTRLRGSRYSIILQIKASGDAVAFERAQDETRLVMRARRHITGNREEDFFIGTAQSYISLWESISGAFFSVFVMVSSISAVVGGIVIMNVMLVSVTERTKEIGVRRAVGATEGDILRQFLTESLLQCLMGGSSGVLLGFLCAVALRSYTAFPASVQPWVAVTGVLLSSAIGLFFGIYPSMKAARLDPVEALRAE